MPKSSTRSGRFLMPGLWDNHQHFGDADGMLDLANGVTSARDMANDTDGFLKRVERFDNGTEIGPRVLKAGIIDGTGEFAGPTKMRVDTAEEAIKDVDWYADHGYVPDQDLLVDQAGAHAAHRRSRARARPSRQRPRAGVHVGAACSSRAAPTRSSI